MKKITLAALLLTPCIAMAQPVANPAGDPHRFMDQAGQQTAAELTAAVISLRATVAQLQDENARLKAEVAKLTPPPADPAK